MKKGITMMLGTAPKTLDIYLYGVVEGDYYDWWTGETIKSETSANSFLEKLNGFGDMDNVNLYINSLGGSCFEGHAIYNILKRCKAHKVARVDGYACSVASIIAMACDEVVMPRNTLMLIHNAWTYASGNASELRKQADDLEIQNEAFKNCYLDKSGGKISLEKLTELMDAESFLTAEMCVEYGLADRVEMYDAEISEPDDDGKNKAKQYGIKGDKLYAALKKQPTTAEIPAGAEQTPAEPQDGADETRCKEQFQSEMIKLFDKFTRVI